MDVGDYSIPDTGIDDAEELVRTIQHQLGGVLTSENDQELAIAIGHETAESGAFRAKIADLKKYGLLEGWGDKSLTARAHDLLENEEGAILDILDDIPLYSEAHSEFGEEPPELDDWKQFLEDRGIDDPEQSSAKRAWRQYNELTRKLPAEEPGNQSTEDVLEKEREFNYYLEKIEHENTREHAIEVIRTNVRDTKLPDAEPLDEILSIIRYEEYPNYQRKFLNILERICKNNRLEQLGEGKRDEVITVLYDNLDTYSSEQGISENRKLASSILDILEILQPDDIVGELWDLLKDRLIAANEYENPQLRQFAKTELGNRLMKGNSDLVEKFYAEMEEEAEQWLWETMKDADSDLHEDCVYLLTKMGVQ